MTGALLIVLWVLLLFDGVIFLAALADDPAPDHPSTTLSCRSSPNRDHALVAPKSDEGGSRITLHAPSSIHKSTNPSIH